MDKLVQVLADAAEFGHLAWSQGRLPTSDGAQVSSDVGVEDLGYVIYTSGSTGRPKGVLLHHKGWNNTNSWTTCFFHLGPGMSWLCVTTIGFDVAMLELVAPLQVGMRIVIANQQECFDMSLFKELLERCKPDVCFSTPSRWRMLVDAGWNGNGAEGPGLIACTGGEALTPALRDMLQARCSMVYNGFGPTEATVVNTAQKCSATKPVTLGAPARNNLAYVVDEQTLALVPVGVPGELLLGGVQIARGYHNRPELTKERFIESPFPRPLGFDTESNKLYRTGDLVRWLSNGELEFLGRIDFQVKLRGLRIELSEVEAALVRHGAGQACALALQGNTILVAFVTPADADIKSMRNGARDELPGRSTLPLGRCRQRHT